MTLDDELLRKAKDAGDRMTEAERQSQLARADYHTMIRRLHLAGGSLREIAGALALSHQRVQQIVDSAGGSWWSRVWRTRNPSRDAVCTFCERPPSEVAKLIAGPDVFVCDECVARAQIGIEGRGDAAFAPAPEKTRARCSFCGKRPASDRRMAMARAGNVCSECLAVCRQILADRARA
jgi:hypothetical protein